MSLAAHLAGAVCDERCEEERILHVATEPTVVLVWKPDISQVDHRRIGGFLCPRAFARPYGRALARVRLRTPVPCESGLPALSRARPPHLEVGRGFCSQELFMTNHPLTENPWLVETEPDCGQIALERLHLVDRTRYAIKTIVRMVGNSASEPDATGSQPLDAWTVVTLMGGVESLCDYLGDLTEDMLEQARLSIRAVDSQSVVHSTPSPAQ